MVKQRRSPPKRKKRGAKRSKGLSVQTFRGLNKKRMEKKGSRSYGKRVRIDQGDTVPVQFLQKPEDFVEFEMHSFQEDRRWNYVPYAGPEAPLSQDENEKRRKTSYRFACNVYNLKERKVQILEGPKDLASRIFFRYERNPTKFLRRTFEITKFPTNPVSYEVAVGEDPPVKASGMELHDIDEYLEEQLREFYGDDLENLDVSGLEDDGIDALDDDEDDGLDIFYGDDDDDDEDEEEEGPDIEDMLDMPAKELKSYARSIGVKQQAKNRKHLIKLIQKKRGW